MVPLFLLILLIYFLFLSFFIYVLICGNNKFHRDGFIGKVYYLMMVKLPAKLNSCATKFIPKKYANNTNATSCMGKGGPCRYFIAIFYMCIYAFFVGVYVYYIHPQVPRLYPNHVQLHRILTFLVLPWPWIIFIAFQFMDPGEITPTNVLSYMKEYPYDNAIHPEGRVCRTLHIPIVARSRYCQYTNRRVAYVHFNSKSVFFFF
ncbi:hypothetical protein TRFO_07325 [Tritrichomonas foetus]|uniref:Palmitoyltransferase n=1 Tax=Tritrichomonas foetus TaxID=1144522 RepID=A0A1J4JSK4_9EUKA|nr:hypothetical protein TRFO_07325 [Tritrichomonas foetus]|eukprot:OHT02119.1 hypothetical protein TRFO_07325 [Tritrichomonas foetus]